MADRYETPTDADMERHYADPAPVDLMHRCTHEGACLRVMGKLCFNDEAYADKWGKENEKAGLTLLVDANGEPLIAKGE